MKIFFLIDSLGTGGAEKSTVKLAIFLKQNGHNISFYCLDQRAISYENNIRENNIPLIFIPKGSFIRKLRFLIKQFKINKPEIIHSVLFRSDLLLRFSSPWISNVLLIQSLVSTPYSEERKKDVNIHWIKFIMVKYLDKLSAFVFPAYYHFITKSVYQHYKKLYSLKRNYRIIYRGREINSSNPSLNQNFTLINVGRQEFAKGQIDILKALKYLKTNIDSSVNIKLEILGFEGKQSKILSDYIKENKLEENVRIQGFVTNVEERLILADVFVFPSYYEGLGGALIEAFAAKLPCICSDISVLKEVVGSENGALFVKPGDYKELAGHIYDLYSNKRLQVDLSNYSYMRFLDKFQIDVIHDEMLKLYVDLVNNRKK